MPYPSDRKYTKEHEWITADGAIGITNHAQDSLGDIVFVELPKVGAEITTGKTFGTVESVKAVSDLFAPVSGTVTAVNESSGHSSRTSQQRRPRFVDDQSKSKRSSRVECSALRSRLR